MILNHLIFANVDISYIFSVCSRNWHVLKTKYVTITVRTWHHSGYPLKLTLYPNHMHIFIPCRKHQNNRWKNVRHVAPTRYPVDFHLKCQLNINKSIENLIPSRPRNSQMSYPIRSEFELLRDFISVLVFFKFDEDPIKNERVSLGTPFSHYRFLCLSSLLASLKNSDRTEKRWRHRFPHYKALSVAMETRVLIHVPKHYGFMTYVFVSCICLFLVSCTCIVIFIKI